MANILPNAVKAKLIRSTWNLDLTTATVKAALVDSGTVPMSATLTNFSDISAGVVGTPQTLTSKSFDALVGAGANSSPGVFDAADVSFPNVTGNSAEYIAIYVDTGTASTSQLIMLVDQVASGLPVTPNTGAINIQWDGVNGVFRA